MIAKYSPSLAFAVALCLALLIILPVADSDEPRPSVLFVLMCQSQLSSYHASRCAELQRHLESQVVEASPSIAVALSADLVDPNVEAFFYLPILVRNHSSLSSADFVFFCHEETRLSLPRLLTELARYNSSEPVFLGSPLQDQGYFIVHHFSQSKHLYPFVYCGFAMSRGLVLGLASHFHAHRAQLSEYEFRIDPAYELATLISIELHMANLTPVDAMCPGARNATEDCVSWTTETFRLPECSEPVSNTSSSPLLSRTLFAVKTHRANFATVLPIARDTWANQVPNIRYYADIDDPTIPAVACGVPNTERGHCDKLNRILLLMRNDSTAGGANETGRFDWFVISDDDTLFSVPRLMQLVSCYAARTAEDGGTQAIVLGEKYGYLSSDGLHGYAYPTGGSGFALNRAALVRLTDSPGVTRCGSAQSPDDMSLGMWLRTLGVPLFHSHLLHQARPVEYAAELLSAQLPVSFHKHYDIDPRKVHADWLGGGGGGAESEKTQEETGDDSSVIKEEL